MTGGWAQPGWLVAGATVLKRPCNGEVTAPAIGPCAWRPPRPRARGAVALPLQRCCVTGIAYPSGGTGQAGLESRQVRCRPHRDRS